MTRTVDPRDPYELRTRLRERLAAGAVGTFGKLPVPEVLELFETAGLDFAVIDLEHSALTPADAVALAGHACLLGLPALVRLPEVDAGLVNRLLEAGAAGIQLSMLRSAAQTRALRRAALYAPEGARSISLVHRAAGFGSWPLEDVVAAARAAPPVLVGQIESDVERPLTAVVRGLDVAFVETTDLAVTLGLKPGSALLAARLREIEQAARTAGAAFGGWTPDLEEAKALGLGDAGYLITGSDLQVLATGLKGLRA